MRTVQSGIEMMMSQNQETLDQLEDARNGFMTTLMPFIKNFDFKATEIDTDDLAEGIVDSLVIIFEYFPGYDQVI